jgi:YidC/Oxa1 family membrane protein insertase
VNVQESKQQIDNKELPQLPLELKESVIDEKISGLSKSQESQIIKLETDVLKLEIDLKGGSLVGAALKKYPEQAKESSAVVELLGLDNKNLFTVQSGLLGDEQLKLPTHRDIFHIEDIDKPITNDNGKYRLVLVSEGSQGIKVKKIFEIKDGSYVINLSHQINNGTNNIIAVRDYRQFLRGIPKEDNQSAFIYTYTGGAWYSPKNKFKKVDFSELEKTSLDEEVTDGWLAMLQHYFVGALVPEKSNKEKFYSKHLGNERYLLGYYSQSQSIDPSSTISFNGSIWLGPKLQESLNKLAPGLELTVDYGWLTIIAKPIYWLLTQIYNLLGNWGWSIVVLTILIKIAFYRLSATSYKSMAAMRKVTPKLQAIKERYGEDKEKFNKAMMELYQKEKINPLGGCLPIVVQIPVFIALYWVLLESVEMRDAPFILWITNLSMKDPYYVLPLIMGVTMYIQQKLNPAPPDPVQAKIMMSLPFIFTVFFAFFPSGLVLYWVVNNILSIAQQWHITRQLEQT